MLCEARPSRGVWGHAPQEILESTCSELASGGCLAMLQAVIVTAAALFQNLHKCDTGYYNSQLRSLIIAFVRSHRVCVSNNCVSDLVVS